MLFGQQNFGGKLEKTKTKHKHKLQIPVKTHNMTKQKDNTKQTNKQNDNTKQIGQTNSSMEIQLNSEQQQIYAVGQKPTTN